MEVQVRRGDLADVDSLEPLWAGMVEQHREVAAAEWPVRAAADAWRIRQAEYRAWLADGSGTLFVAEPVGVVAPVGYAMLQVHAPGATWDLGAQVGEVESLAVAAAARGAGVGTALLAACRAELSSRGIVYWSVAVVEANRGAVRLYEREGFRAYYRLLLGEVER
ncbi:MAG: GNAT family N-acetyltransferase [Candidatus Dormibacteraeota bacterium]|uniref:GNAT family N-acetyltransferase n=1 Tax=Candidatus Aeolococcus gillhamiae TaxID=3127015 RepID=A0A2W5Z969_9BACT|nr:GNAT family N-acetyltransferase [Candidatus Dormibacteraeota bacterium]PZR81922.1 MAG: GNAT family N-acetyltransferase [Candidatus Dormibacter sp. RRmetagenome_bin12]